MNKAISKNNNTFICIKEISPYFKENENVTIEKNFKEVSTLNYDLNWGRTYRKVEDGLVFKSKKICITEPFIRNIIKNDSLNLYFKHETNKL